jgi:hypothetical protein
MTWSRNALALQGDSIKNKYRTRTLTNQVIEGRFSERYSFECYDITDPNHPSETSTWERGPKDAKTILYWLSNDKNVLDIIRHGPPGSKTTTYDIHPPID